MHTTHFYLTHISTHIHTSWQSHKPNNTLAHTQRHSHTFRHTHTQTHTHTHTHTHTLTNKKKIIPVWRHCFAVDSTHHLLPKCGYLCSFWGWMMVTSSMQLSVNWMSKLNKSLNEGILTKNWKHHWLIIGIFHTFRVQKQSIFASSAMVYHHAAFDGPRD